MVLLSASTDGIMEYKCTAYKTGKRK